ncbi:hypothetical protein BGZ65_011637, partial [Modicella reniformis]
PRTKRLVQRRKFQGYHGDVQLGLAFEGTIDLRDPTFMDNAFNQYTLSNNEFSIYLPPVGSGEGELILGGVGEHRFTGELTYNPVALPAEYWRITVQDIKYETKLEDRMQPTST